MPRLIAMIAVAVCAACASSSADDQSTQNPDQSRWCCPKNVTDCSCPSGTDTCSGGKNMSNVRASGNAVDGADGASLTIAWDIGTGPGANLPATYFDGVKPVAVADAGPHALVRVAHSAERELSLVLSGTIAELSGNTVKFTLEFPDRRSATSCQHSGMADRYYLDVELSFGEAGALTTTKFEERVSLGDI